MKKYIACVLLFLLVATIACSAVGTATPTEGVITNTPRASETSTVTNTPALLEPSETATLEVPFFTPTPIVSQNTAVPSATHELYIYYTTDTPAGDDFIEILAPLVNVRKGACLQCPRVSLDFGPDGIEATEDDTYEQLEEGTIRKVYMIYHNVTTGEVWARITPETEQGKWVSVEPKFCRDANRVVINCSKFRLE